MTAIARLHAVELDDAVHGQIGVVFSWMKVSVPLVNQLIWPGAVNAAVPMKVKSWLPATVSFASMLVKWSTSPRSVEVRDDVGVEIEQADLVDGLPQESVAGAAARHGVLAVAAVDDVDTVIADDTIIVEAAGEGDGRRPDGLQNLLAQPAVHSSRMPLVGYLFSVGVALSLALVSLSSYLEAGPDSAAKLSMAPTTASLVSGTPDKN